MKTSAMKLAIAAALLAAAGTAHAKPFAADTNQGSAPMLRVSEPTAQMLLWRRLLPWGLIGLRDIFR